MWIVKAYLQIVATWPAFDKKQPLDKHSKEELESLPKIMKV